MKVYWLSRLVTGTGICLLGWLGFWQVVSAQEATPEVVLSPETTPEITSTGVNVLPTRPQAISSSATSITPNVQLMGIVRHQNDEDQRGILVKVINHVGQVVGESQTDSQGKYVLNVPVIEQYELRFNAPYHQSIHVVIDVGNPLPLVILPAGDLNSDGCINQQDMELLHVDLQSANPQYDMTGDGKVNSAELALLAGNYDANCIPVLATATPMPIVIATQTAPPIEEVHTPIATPLTAISPTQPISLTPTPISPTQTTVPTLTLDIEITEEVTLIPTVSSTDLPEITSTISVSETLLPTASATPLNTTTATQSPTVTTTPTPSNTPTPTEES